MPELWRVPAAHLDEAQDDAVRLAVGDMVAAGVDVVTDGEQRRESYFNQFANGLSGIDLERPGEAINRLGKRQAVPRVTGPIERERPVFLRDAQFLRVLTARRIKLAVPGPFTLAALAQDEHYRDPERLAMAYARAVNEELRELEPVLDWIQLDEPYLEARADHAKAYALPAIDRALAGLRKPTCIHVCFGYAFSHALAGTSKSGGYRFALELERSAATHLSLEAAQPGLTLSALAATLADGRTGSFPILTRTFPTATGAVEQPGTVTGDLSVPGGSDRVPAVIVLHSCSGVTPNVTEWARALNRMGYVALVLDSFTGRGVNEVCTGHTPVSVGSRLADVFRAQELLVTHPRIDPGRIGVLGFSHGGWATLWASQAWYQRRFMRGTLPPPAAYAAFYPAGCNARLINEADMAGGPVRIFHGTAADW